ncbi:MAG: alpha/beta fold hydrolase [Hyalangium sp.]|uniref:alpha/beta fold hydrolase n=1 Tax=Hyalangium sp. TaxID=2028555 RepID=UPI00389A9D7E
MSEEGPRNESTENSGGPREFWFESDGTRLFAVENGRGRPIILLHGGLANHLACLPLVGSLPSRFRVITPDLRSSGKSVDGRPLTWDRLADDVAALMRHLGAERAVVGGVSSGSGAALRFALRYPEKTAALVVVTPIYAGEERGLTAQQAATFKMMDAAGSRAIGEGVQVLRPLYEHLPSPIREKALAMIDGFDAASVAATTQFIASGAQPFASASEMHGLAVPTLLIPGNDPLHPAEVSNLYAAHIPNCVVSEPQVADRPTVIGDFCERRAAW